MKKLIKNWLEKLEKANQESFGSGPLDCCELGENSKKGTTNNKKTTNNKNVTSKRN